MHSKKIVIDFEKIKDPFSGLGQWCHHFSQELLKQNELSPFFYLPESCLNMFPQYPNVIRLRKIARKIPFLVPKSDVFHAIHQDSPFWPRKMSRYVLTIHDLNGMHEKSDKKERDHYLKQLQRKIDRADVITYISEFTKDQVHEYLKIKRQQEQVIYNGISLTRFEAPKAPNLKPQRPFLFTIGTVVPKKNFHTLIKMMKHLPEFDLIIAGTTFHNYAQTMKYQIQQERLDDRIRLVGTINDEEKFWYLSHSKAFVFPSLLEGFGLPVAEAMSLGLPLFVSNSTSLPEVAGSDAFYFENYDDQSMARTIQHGLESFDEDQKNRLIERSKKFSWEKATQQFLEIYKSL